MDKVFILGGLRSYIGVRNSAYRHVPAEHLGAAVLKELTARYQPSKIDMMICGNCVGGGGNITRLMALEAGLSESIPSFTGPSVRFLPGGRHNSRSQDTERSG